MPTKASTRTKTKATAKKRAVKSTSTTKSTNSTKQTKKTTTTRKYSPVSQKEVEKEMRKFKKGTAKSGKAGTPVKSRKQAIAIGLSKARAKGAKVSKKRS